MSEFLRLEGIRKSYGPVVANDDVSLGVHEREVHALLGENGAGKSTLMNIVYGMVKADAGRIWIQGDEVQIDSSSTAMRLGIGMVHQNFTLIPTFTVAENLMLGKSLVSRWDHSLRDARAGAARLAKQYGLGVDPDALVSDLSVGAQQRVEILKVLYRGARLIIMDEPTAVLTPPEVEDLLGNIRELVKEGYSVIFITHKLDEVMKFSDRVSVLRNGRRVETVPTEETDKRSLARLMMGRDVVFRVDRSPPRLGDTVLEAEDLWVENESSRPVIRGLSFAVRAGESLGIAGVDGNGQRELAETLWGLRPVVRGRLKLLGREITGLKTTERRRLGMRSIPSDRSGDGLVGGFTVQENLVMEELDHPDFSRAGVLKQRALRRHASQLVEQYRIRVPGTDVNVGNLSGGNQQKILVARCLATRPQALICSQPTRGLDVGATEYVRRRILEARNAGAAIVLISTELDEILQLSDRIGVIFRGEIMGFLPGGWDDLQVLGEMMAGEKSSAEND